MSRESMTRTAHGTYQEYTLEDFEEERRALKELEL